MADGWSGYRTEKADSYGNTYSDLRVDYIQFYGTLTAEYGDKNIETKVLQIRINTGKINVFVVQ
ncbi:hypothetical protein [Anaerocolumna sp. MB42-C2]|uniref:hypothetical protein n=1 Tax=Anaerocolumna sp. MB42-C2 TaxID=3070997 RepID=UPI0027DF2399|nr:hypothetical protein [Anaerocolumna sp. MB42-C2]WMJ90194.1 hypothetical protein RBU59_11905 [Anaerocolumna sp. MB42-C2]